MRELHLFAGAGGGILGGMLLGHKTVCAVEIEPYCQQVLKARQQDGILPDFPIFGDIKSFDGRPWRGKVDIVAGGFPCQDISVANANGNGIEGARSGLWKEMARIICEVKPRLAFVENSPAILFRGLGTVLADVAKMGMHARWGVLGAGDIGAWHRRARFWLLATNSRGIGVHRSMQGPVCRESGIPWEQDVRGIKDLQGRSSVPSPQLCRAHNGVANYVDRTRTIGNGQVPAVAATAFKILSEGLI